jgi:hypothetical protein
MQNEFNQIDAQNEISRLAQVQSQEVFEPMGNDVSEFAHDETGTVQECEERPQDDEGWPHNDHTCMSDGEALASAGFGTDEDYGGCHGGDGDEY